MKTRVISGIVIAVAGFAAVYAGGAVLAVVLMLCAMIGMMELQKVTGVIDKGRTVPAVTYASLAGAVFYYAMLYFQGSELSYPAAAVVELIILMTYVLTFTKISSAKVISVGFSFIYLAVMLGFVFLIRESENGKLCVWLVFLSSWVADTCAYFAGVLLGKHKMSPVLSPKKTIEGAIGGIAGSALAGFLFALAFDGEMLWEFPLICGVSAVISIFGDLAASAIKRDNNIKDYGSLIPGHGGILDRFDSVIFTAPAIYFLLFLIVI